MQVIHSDFHSMITGKMEKHGTPGSCVAIIEKGSMMFSGTFGYKDEQGHRVDHHTLFECASLTKPVFAAIALHLSNEGFFSLDEPIVSHFPETWSNHPGYKEITARQVLSHTSGLVNWAARPLPMLFWPGSRFSYSGEGYYLLQKALEKKMDMTLDEMMQYYIFSPLQMNSACLWTEDVASRFSKGFDKEGRICKVRDARRSTGNGPEPNAAWSLYANAGDYALFLCALLNGQISRINYARILPQMRKSLVPCGNGVCWGAGLGLLSSDPGIIWHWGDNAGFQSLFVCDALTKDGIVTVTNSSSGLEFCLDLLSEASDLPSSALTGIRSFIETAES